jgi:hypothetical protein
MNPTIAKVLLPEPGRGQLFTLGHPLDAASQAAARRLLGVEGAGLPVECVDRVITQPDHGPAPKGGGGVRLRCGDAARDFRDMEALRAALAAA